MKKLSYDVAMEFGEWEIPEENLVPYPLTDYSQKPGLSVSVESAANESRRHLLSSETMNAAFSNS